MVWLADNAGVLAGATIGPSAVDCLIGVGGMGEVYCARDTKLNRDVAIAGVKQRNPKILVP